MRSTKYDKGTITALGHAGFLIEWTEPEFRLVFDAFDVRGVEPVDYIFVSHQHYDHCDPNSIRQLIKEGTQIIAPEPCRAELAEFADHFVAAPTKDKAETKNFKHWTVPAYNLNKFRTPNEVFHPRELGGVGHVVEIGKTRLFHAGDTDFVPEIAELKKIDVAFLPISGTFVMTLEEAIQAAEALQADLTIPMHYGKLLGSVAEANRFQNLLKEKLKVAVLSTDNE